MATTTPRLIRIPQLGDTPDVPADMSRLATDLDSRLIWTQGLLAARTTPPSPNLAGTVYWATDDTTAGPTGTLSYWDGAVWSIINVNTPTAGQKAALAGTVGTPNGTTNKYVTATDPKQSINVLSALQVREVGEANQIRAGRVLTPADFTNMGLSTPLALWNLGDLTDASGSAHPLTNKGAAVFLGGITGAGTEAALFPGSATGALYVANAGWMQIANVTWGSWHKTAKRGTLQSILTRCSVSLGIGSCAWWSAADSTNVARVGAFVDSIDTTGAAFAVLGVTDICDDRWHHIVGSYDGARVRLYVDGVLEASIPAIGTLHQANSPIDVGSVAADASTAGTQGSFGRIDEAFVTAEVLSDDQIRNLYCASIPHTLTAIPAVVHTNIRRRRRGGTILTSDFPSTPIRLYNFTAAALTDAGIGGQSVTVGGGGVLLATQGVDGKGLGAYHFGGAHTGLTSTDAGLPSGTSSRSYGLWFRGGPHAVASGIMGWGTSTTADARLRYDAAGLLNASSGADTIVGPFIQDNFWHHLAVVEDNAPFDGVKRKLYVDGRLVGTSLTLNTLTLAGAGKFRIGTFPDATAPMLGNADGVFAIGAALTAENVRALYNLGSQPLAASSKSEAEHIEAIETTRILATFDTIEGTDLVDLQVSA